MRSYRIARRSFLAGVGGALGLRMMLDNMVSAAQGQSSPPRFLMTHWPVGTVHYWFKPQGTGRDFVTSRILQPFDDAGLREDMIALFGMHVNFGANGGGGHEAGTPMTTTGTGCPGTRSNGGEADDGVAGGPSFDQIFLKNVAALQTPGVGYANAICDARVDSLETSTQCLSYDYATRSIASARPGGDITEHIPLLPDLSPAQLYTKLFSSFMPGGATDDNMDAAATALVMRKSVLDYALDELDQVKRLAPASEASKIDFHADVIRKIEAQLSQQIEDGTVNFNCEPPPAPDPDLVGQNGGRNGNYGQAGTSTADDAFHADVGRAHYSIIKSAFQCDLIRVATFQWSPGTNHVSFKGMYPDDPNAIYMHHPLSHDILSNRGWVTQSKPSGREGSIVEYLANVQTWYNQRTAEMLNDFKEATDSYGQSLLDHTVIPYITEVSDTTHAWTEMPALIFGGKALGMQGGQYIEVGSGGPSGPSINAMWMTVAQAYLGADPLAQLQAEKFQKGGADPIAGCWEAPT